MLGKNTAPQCMVLRLAQLRDQGKLLHRRAACNGGGQEFWRRFLLLSPRYAVGRGVVPEHAELGISSYAVRLFCTPSFRAQR
jgi:hypothetical protein